MSLHPDRTTEVTSAWTAEGVVMLKPSNRAKPGTLASTRRRHDQWWWILTLGLVAGLLLYLFRHV